mmetsp:Transcript_11821/g.25571  ORF Transcript_11821/g.25571 Transcript_11821/m.25571 type:complete len:322 (-) Transcript_11821:634-1599(-)
MIRLLRGSTNSPGRDVCFATLPYHIQLRITSWLSLSELANAARLSSQWSQLARAASQLVRMAVPADANVASGPLEETPVHAICRLNGAQKHILVLDLDETLVRVQPLSLGQQAASMKQAPPAVKTRPGSRAKRATLRLGRRLSQLQPHHVRGTRRFIVHAGTGDAKQKLEVSVRPHVPVLLNYLRRSGAWHVIVWTAAEKSYADAVLDGLEGNARVLTRRLYQQHCAIGPTGFIKARAFAERSHSFPWSRVVLARAQHTSFFFFAMSIWNAGATLDLSAQRLVAKCDVFSTELLAAAQASSVALTAGPAAFGLSSLANAPR